MDNNVSYELLVDIISRMVKKYIDDMKEMESDDLCKQAE